MGPPQPSCRPADRLLERQPVGQQLFYKVWDDLGIRLRVESVAVRSEPRLEFGVVLHDAVVNDDDLAGAVRVRVRVHVGGGAVRGPPRVADALPSADRLVLNEPPEVVQFARGAPDRKVSEVVRNGKAGAVVAAVGEARQPVQQDAGCLTGAGVSEYPAHTLHRSVALRPSPLGDGYRFRDRRSRRMAGYRSAVLRPKRLAATAGGDNIQLERALRRATWHEVQ